MSDCQFKSFNKICTLVFQVLRLICLQSVTNSGLKPKVLEHYKREIVQTYGFQHLLTLINLEKTGLLKTHVIIQ